MLYPLLLPPWIWLFRFRQRCGYGVHSPYAFDFITGVIYERGEYYAYGELDRLLPWYAHVPHYLPWPFHSICLRPQRILHLLFRLTNFSEAKLALILGKEDLPHTYMRAALPRAQWHTEPQEGTAYGLIYVGKNQEMATPTVLSQLPLEGPQLIIIDFLRNNHPLFESWKNETTTTLTFDLYDMGIVMRGLSLNKMDYVINF